MTRHARKYLLLSIKKNTIKCNKSKNEQNKTKKAPPPQKKKKKKETQTNVKIWENQVLHAMKLSPDVHYPTPTGCLFSWLV